MSISVQNRKILWGLSGNRCAYSGCNQLLHLEVSENGSSLIGEECHIEAQSGNGPRFNSKLTEKQIDHYSNLILLCPTHHKIVDDNPEEYTVAALKKMKVEHENRVRRALDDKSENDDMHYESIIMYIDMMLEFEYWEAWTSYLLNAQPWIRKDLFDSFEDIHKFIVSRVWPGRYPELESAANNFNRVLWDFNDVFIRHSEERLGEYRTCRFYRTEPYDHKVADALLPSYNRHVCLIHLMIFELTRAGNHLCDMMRKYVDSGYRLAEGKLMVDDQCPEYEGKKAYAGLETFAKQALERFPDKVE